MELWTAFILGLVGSLHCAGMCGPLVLAMPTGRSTSATLPFVLGRVTYNLGRIATYSLLGGIFGLIGHTFALAGLQRWVSLGVGIIVLAVLVISTRKSLSGPTSRIVALVKRGLAPLLARQTFGSVFMLGALNGLLPCGLVYAACAGAVALGGVMSVQYMVAFGLGTVPMMLAIALAGKKLQFTLRLRFEKLIPISVFTIGVLLIFRGLALGIPYLSPDVGHLKCCH